MPLSPEWAKLPKRHCDDCGKLYKPVRPSREGEGHFCCDNCRKSYHKHGGAYRKLRGEMRKMIEKAITEMQRELWDMVRTQVVASLAQSMPAPSSNPNGPSHSAMQDPRR